jgi:hypothetical protein
VLHCEVWLTDETSRPAAQMPSHSQIRIQRLGAIDQRCATLGISKYPDCNTTARERIGIVFAAFHSSLRDLHRMRGFN